MIGLKHLAVVSIGGQNVFASVHTTLECVWIQGSRELDAARVSHLLPTGSTLNTLVHNQILPSQVSHCSGQRQLAVARTIFSYDAGGQPTARSCGPALLTPGDSL